MSKANESAFPVVTTDASYDNGEGPYGYTYSEGGLTKRELFAAMAMQGLMGKACYGHVDGQGDDLEIAKLAAKYADALLAELSKGGE